MLIADGTAIISSVMRFVNCPLQNLAKESLAMAKNEKSSARVATLAAKVLRNPHSSSVSKTLAASVLTQAPDKKRK